MSDTLLGADAEPIIELLSRIGGDQSSLTGSELAFPAQHSFETMLTLLTMDVIIGRLNSVEDPAVPSGILIDTTGGETAEFSCLQVAVADREQAIALGRAARSVHDVLTAGEGRALQVAREACQELANAGLFTPRYIAPYASS